MDFTLPGVLAAIVIVSIILATTLILCSMVISTIERSIHFMQLEQSIVHVAKILQTFFKNANLSLGSAVTHDSLSFKIQNIDGTVDTITIRYRQDSPTENSLWFSDGTTNVKIASFPKTSSLSFEMKGNVPCVVFSYNLANRTMVRSFTMSSDLSF